MSISRMKKNQNSRSSSCSVTYEETFKYSSTYHTMLNLELEDVFAFVKKTAKSFDDAKKSATIARNDRTITGHWKLTKLFSRRLRKHFPETQRVQSSHRDSYPGSNLGIHPNPALRMTPGQCEWYQLEFSSI